MERQIEEAIAPKEGDDPIDEETKQLLHRKARFKIITRSFFCKPEDRPKSKKGKTPVLPAEHDKKEEVKKLVDDKKTPRGDEKKPAGGKEEVK